MRVRDLVGRDRAVVTVAPEASLSKALGLLMDRGIGALPVVAADGAPVGILAERDVVRALYQHGADVTMLTAAHLMRRPAPSCDADDSLHEATARITRQRLRHLLVCERGRLIGILSVGDLVKHRLDELETEAGVLRDYVTGLRARV